MYNVQIVNNGEVTHILGVVDFRFDEDFVYIFFKKDGIYDRLEIEIDNIDSLVISFDQKAYDQKYGI